MHTLGSEPRPRHRKAETSPAQAEKDQLARELLLLRNEARHLWQAYEMPAERTLAMLMQATTPDILPATDDVIGLYEQEEAERASDCHIMELSYRVEQLHDQAHAHAVVDGRLLPAVRGQRLAGANRARRQSALLRLEQRRELGVLLVRGGERVVHVYLVLESYVLE